MPEINKNIAWLNNRSLMAERSSGKTLMKLNLYNYHIDSIKITLQAQRLFNWPIIERKELTHDKTTET